MDNVATEYLQLNLIQKIMINIISFIIYIVITKEVGPCLFTIFFSKSHSTNQIKFNKL